MVRGRLVSRSNWRRHRSSIIKAETVALSRASSATRCTRKNTTTPAETPTSAPTAARLITRFGCCLLKCMLCCSPKLLVDRPTDVGEREGRLKCAAGAWSSRRPWGSAKGTIHTRHQPWRATVLRHSLRHRWPARKNRMQRAEGAREEKSGRSSPIRRIQRTAPATRTSEPHVATRLAVDALRIRPSLRASIGAPGRTGTYLENESRRGPRPGEPTPGQRFPTASYI